MYQDDFLVRHLLNDLNRLGYQKKLITLGTASALDLALIFGASVWIHPVKATRKASNHQQLTWVILQPESTYKTM